MKSTKYYRILFAVIFIIGLSFSVVLTPYAHKVQTLAQFPPGPPEQTIVVTQYVGRLYVNSNTLYNVNEDGSLTNVLHNNKNFPLKKTISFKRECTECTNIVTSSNYSIMLVLDPGKPYKHYDIKFHCDLCDESFHDSADIPLKKTKVEIITTQTVK